MTTLNEFAEFSSEVEFVVAVRLKREAGLLASEPGTPPHVHDGVSA